MMRMRSDWGVELVGLEHDLKNLRLKLNGAIEGPNSIFISRLNDLYVLRCSQWDSISDLAMLKEKSFEDLELIRGCIHLLDGCGTIEIGTIIRLGPMDEIGEQNRDSMIGVRVFTPEDKWQNPAEFRKLFHHGKANHLLRAAINDFKSDPTWFDIYKSIEALLLFCGGEKKLQKSHPAFAKQVDKAKQTANSFRHSRGKFEPIRKPMLLPDAIKVTKELFSFAIATLGEANSDGSSSFAHEVVDRSYPPETVVGLKKLALENVPVTTGE